jgi:hypothetical protein
MASSIAAVEHPEKAWDFAADNVMHPCLRLYQTELPLEHILTFYKPPSVDDNRRPSDAADPVCRAKVEGETPARADDSTVLLRAKYDPSHKVYERGLQIKDLQPALETQKTHVVLPWAKGGRFFA